jgi:hypothetical protein
VKVGDAILKLDFNTALEAFKVDRDGIQVAHQPPVSGRDLLERLPARSRSPQAQSVER